MNPSSMHFFVIAILALVVYAILAYLNHRTAKLLISNLVTMQTRNLSVDERLTKIGEIQTEALDKFLTTYLLEMDDRSKLNKFVVEDLKGILVRLRTAEDRIQQYDLVIKNVLGESVNDIIVQIRKDLAKMVEDAVAKSPAAPAGFTIDQVVEAINKGGAVLDKLGPLGPVGKIILDRISKSQSAQVN